MESIWLDRLWGARGVHVGGTGWRWMLVWAAAKSVIIWVVGRIAPGAPSEARSGIARAMLAQRCACGEIGTDEYRHFSMRTFARPVEDRLQRSAAGRVCRRAQRDLLRPADDAPK